jgi:hypothetical protein
MRYQIYKQLLILFFCFLSIEIHATSYLINDNGTVLDKNSGLTWQKCSMGQNNDANCSRDPKITDWYTAMDYCSSLTLAGINWRLPSKEELKSIFDRLKFHEGAAIDTKAFPGTKDSFYWTSDTSLRKTSPDWADTVNFYSSHGMSNTSSHEKTSVGYVRCVTGNYQSKPLYIDNRNGTINDTGTGLTWQACTRGQKYRDNRCYGYPEGESWPQARYYCYTLRLGGLKWRLPKVNEINSINKHDIGLMIHNYTNYDIGVKLDGHFSRMTYWTATSEKDKYFSLGQNHYVEYDKDDLHYYSDKYKKIRKNRKMALSYRVGMDYIIDLNQHDIYNEGHDVRCVHDKNPGSYTYKPSRSKTAKKSSENTESFYTEYYQWVSKYITAYIELLNSKEFKKILNEYSKMYASYQKHQDVEKLLEDYMKFYNKYWDKF